MKERREVEASLSRAANWHAGLSNSGSRPFPTSISPLFFNVSDLRGVSRELWQPIWATRDGRERKCMPFSL